MHKRGLDESIVTVAHRVQTTRRMHILPGSHTPRTKDACHIFQHIDNCKNLYISYIYTYVVYIYICTFTYIYIHIYLVSKCVYQCIYRCIYTCIYVPIYIIDMRDLTLPSHPPPPPSHPFLLSSVLPKHRR